MAAGSLQTPSLPEGYTWDDQSITPPPNQSTLPMLPNGYQWDDQTTTFPEHGGASTQAPTLSIPEPPVAPSWRDRPMSDMQPHERAAYEAALVAPEQGKAQLEKEKPLLHYKEVEIPPQALDAMDAELKKLGVSDPMVRVALAKNAIGLLRKQEDRNLTADEAYEQGFRIDAENQPIVPGSGDMYKAPINGLGETIGLYKQSVGSNQKMVVRDPESKDTGYAEVTFNQYNPDKPTGIRRNAVPNRGLLGTISEGYEIKTMPDGSVQIFSKPTVRQPLFPGEAQGPAITGGNVSGNAATPNGAPANKPTSSKLPLPPVKKIGEVSPPSGPYKAAQSALQQVERNLAAVETYERTARANMQLFINQGQRVLDLGRAWANKPLRTIQRGLLSADELAAYDAARQVASTEIARVLGNPNLTGVLTNEARDEVGRVMNSDYSLSALIRVARMLNRDMDNRLNSLREERATLDARVRQGADIAPPSGGKIAIKLKNPYKDASGKLITGGKIDPKDFDPNTMEKVQ